MHLWWGAIGDLVTHIKALRSLEALRRWKRRHSWERGLLVHFSRYIPDPERYKNINKIAHLWNGYGTPTQTKAMENSKQVWFIGRLINMQIHLLVTKHDFVGLLPKGQPVATIDLWSPPVNPARPMHLRLPLHIFIPDCGHRHTPLCSIHAKMLYVLLTQWDSYLRHPALYVEILLPFSEPIWQSWFFSPQPASWPSPTSSKYCTNTIKSHIQWGKHNNHYSKRKHTVTKQLIGRSL